MNTRRIRRIAIIIPGGIGTGHDNIGVPVLEQQVRMLGKEFDVVVFSLFRVNSDYKAANFQIFSVPGNGFVFQAWSLFKMFKAQNRKERFDVIHGFWLLPSGFFAVTLGKYFGISSVVSILGGDAISLPDIHYGQLRRRLPRSLARWTISNAGAVTALTRYLVDNLGRQGIVRRGIHILPWGISNEQFPYNPASVKVPYTFLHIANFSAVKDPLTLLEAFKLISAKVDCRLTMVGEGPLLPELEEWIIKNDLSERVTIQPPVRYEHVAFFYPKAMFLLHTSLSEGQSEVVTEAMSSGVLVCGTKVGLLHDLPSCCISVAVGDYQALADAVLRLMIDDGKIASMRSKAKEWTHNHNIGWTVSTTASLYRQVRSDKL